MCLEHGLAYSKCSINVSCCYYIYDCSYYILYTCHACWEIQIHKHRGVSGTDWALQNIIVRWKWSTLLKILKLLSYRCYKEKKIPKKRKNELLKNFKRVICLPPYDYIIYIPNICQRSRLFLFRFRLLKSQFPKVQGISRAFHSVKYQVQRDLE